jgi:3-oxoacyl-[acyl-carrier protein] reductase
MNTSTLAGRVAIVTGSSRGIGKAVAVALAAEGVRLVLHGLEPDELDATEAQLRSKGVETVAVATDLGYAEGADRLFAAARERFGQLDILVNNAGWATPIVHFLEMDEGHWDTVLRTNLKSVYLCTSRAAHMMVEAGTGGSIVSMSSWGAARAHHRMAAYDASKAAIEGFTRAVALDLAPYGIRVNAVGPGVIHTETFDPEAKPQRAMYLPMGRVGEVEEVAPAVLFLASDASSYITGQIIYVDGGGLAQSRPPVGGYPPR